MSDKADKKEIIPSDLVQEYAEIGVDKLIVDEAGGKFTNRKGEEHRFDQILNGGVVITNGVIHDDVLKIMRAS